MEIIEQTSYVEGATENCKDLITKCNRILSEIPNEKVLKMRRGIEQDFVDVVVEGKRLSEDWEDTKLIFSETFYQIMNKYLFDKSDPQQGIFVNQHAFVTKTMERTQANLKQIIYFIVNNYLLKTSGEIPESEVPRMEGHPEEIKSYSPEQVVEVEDKIIKVFVDDDGDSIVTYESGKKVFVSKNKGTPMPEKVFVQPEKINQVVQSPEVGVIHNHAPNREVMGNEALVSTHEADTINQPSNYQNPISMLKRTQEQVAPPTPVVEAEKKLLTIGEKFIGVGFNPSGNENVDSVKASFSDMADYLIQMEQSEEMQNDPILRDLHHHAKQAILSASMSMVRVITYKK
jgi:hypothetical protein